MSQSPVIIYKYVDQEGARKIIANGTLRFGRPADMNDPFDIYIEDLFSDDLDEIDRRSTSELLRLLEKDPEQFARFTDTNPEVANSISNLIGSIPEADRASLLPEVTQELLLAWDPELTEMRRALEPQRQDIIAQFKNTAIFCATLKHDNLLMWAHYAQHHRGVVLGFRPDIERDSILTVTKPVRYSDQRPSFYGTIEKMIASGARIDQGVLEDFRDSLIYTKSTHWSYEEEVRIDIPHGVPVGETAIFGRFFPDELAELYLGYRADEPFRTEIVSAARKLNPKVSIFAACTARETYALNFALVS